MWGGWRLILPRLLMGRNMSAFSAVFAQQLSGKYSDQYRQR